jgi:tRNA-dihydrouridine synthase 3
MAASCRAFARGQLPLRRHDTAVWATAAPDEPAVSTGRDRSATPTPRPTPVAALSPSQRDANTDLARRFAGNLILAPLTRVGTLPFRALCSEFGAPVTLSEMAFARPLARGDRVERTRLRKGPGEACFGFQFTTNNIGEGLAAARLAAEAGASFVDLNAGCPIHEATRRGLGAALLRSTRKLATLAAGIAEGSPLPLTVKIRTGLTANSVNVDDTVAALAMAGVAAVTIHGRTQEQRYKRAADWGAIARAAATHPTLPVVGNGDALAHWEVAARLTITPGGVMTGRGALMCPWMWKDLADGRAWLPSTAERVAVYRRLMCGFRDYLGNDEKGWRKAQYFLPSHFDFLCRWRPWPDDVYGPGGPGHDPDRPLMSRRLPVADPLLGETLAELSPLERALRCADAGAHAALAAAMWGAGSDAEAVRSCEAAAVEGLAGWEEAARAADRGAQDEDGRGGGGGRDDGMAGG